MAFGLAATLTFPSRTAHAAEAKTNLPSQVVFADYHGWSNVAFLNNGLVEAVIVPAAGRVMQFRFVRDADGPFWENRKLDGQTAAATNWETEGSFGGEKAWPSPQSDWGWPPPAGFDGSPNRVTHSNGVVTLIAPVDARYQIRASRIIELVSGEAVMRIRTIFERTAATAGTNKELGVWVVTQLQEPVRCVVPVPSQSVFSNGFTQLGNGMPAQFKHTNGLISFTRDRSASRKLGFDADSLVWIGTNLTLRIDAPRMRGLAKSSYPDNGSSSEVYTHPGAPYIELEFLGPLSKLAVGERLELQTIYRLIRRVEADPEAEARRVLSTAPTANEKGKGQTAPAN